MGRRSGLGNRSATMALKVRIALLGFVTVVGLAGCQTMPAGEGGLVSAVGASSRAQGCAVGESRHSGSKSRLRATIRTNADCSRDVIVFIGGEITDAMADDVVAFDGDWIRPGDNVLYGLNSPGGSVRAGARIAATIGGRGASTAVLGNHRCNSICPVIYSAGVQRFASRNVLFGFHTAHTADGTPQYRVNLLLAGAMATHGVRFDVLRAMMDNTPADDIFWLPVEDAVRIGLITAVID